MGKKVKKPESLLIDIISDELYKSLSIIDRPDLYE